MRRSLMAACGFCLLSLPAVAQEHEIPKVELFGGYSLLRSNGENLNGWKVVIGGSVNRWFGVAADFSGHYRSESTPLGKLKEIEHSFTFGPHFSFRRNRRFTPFAYTLFGVARETTSLAGVGHTEVGFAAELGGGLDMELSEWVALRLFDGAASITRIEGETRTKPKFSFGIVFLLGRK